MDDLDMLDNFSSLIPSKRYKSWKGNILINTHIVYIEIFCPNIPKLDNLEVCIPEIENYNLCEFELTKTVDLVKKQTYSLPDFLKNLVSILSDVWKHDFYSNLQNSPNICTDTNLYSVIQEVNIYDQYIHDIDENLKYITFNVLDICRRNHFIKIYIPEEYSEIKNKPLEFDAMVPLIIIDSFLKANTISRLFDAFKNVVETLNSFWNLNEEIINTCDVIGSYSFKDVNFRIPIDNHVCVDVEIDVNVPYSCPKFNFHGQSNVIEKFQLRLNKVDPILIWNTENNFKKNILDVFGIAELRQYEDQNIVNHFAIECTNSLNDCFICYEQLDTVTKNQIKNCVNNKCDGMYHMKCICTWLLNSGNTPMFGHLQGKCPQCDEDLLVALDNFNFNKT